MAPVHLYCPVPPLGHRLTFQQALADLSPFQQQVTWLQTQENLSCREIGDRMGCSEADVKIAIDLVANALRLSEKTPPRLPRCRKRSSCRGAGVGFRVAA